MLSVMFGVALRDIGGPCVWAVYVIVVVLLWPMLTLIYIYTAATTVQKPIGQKNNFVPPPPLKRFDGCMFTVIQWANFLAWVSSLNVDSSY